MKIKIKKWQLVLFTIFATLVCAFIFSNLSPLQKELDYQVTSSESVESPRFKKILGDLMGPHFENGNSIKTLLNGDEIFPAMLKAISAAEKTITFESYIYWSGSIGDRFVKALSERASAGVKIHVLLDWVGSERIEEAYIQRMKDAGIEVERYHELSWYNISRMNNRTHRKILVVDGIHGFTGGVGIADEWSGNGLDSKKWRDTHYEVRGPVVAQMQAAFFDNWMKVRPEIHHSVDYFPDLHPVANGKNTAAQMFKSSHREGGSSVHIMYLLAIAAAKKSIHLEGAYFVPDPVAIEEIVKARKRGVEVQIIVPGPLSDSKIVRHASRETWGDLLQAGVKIYEYTPAMFHCKVLVVDGYFVSVGSTNFDERSFKLNDEANLNVLDDKLAEEQIEIFQEDLTRSKEISLQDWQNRPKLDKVLEKLAGLWTSQL